MKMSKDDISSILTPRKRDFLQSIIHHLHSEAGHAPNDHCGETHDSLLPSNNEPHRNTAEKIYSCSPAWDSGFARKAPHTFTCVSLGTAHILPRDE